MRSILITACLITIVACKQTEKYLPLITDDFNYAAYSWSLSGESEQWEFYLDYYVNIEKNGHFSLMFRDSFTNKPKYFIGIISDTLGKLIDRTFTTDTFKNNYPDSPQNIAYSGLTYCFDYTKQQSNRRTIIFINSKAPIEINKLSMLLNRLIYSGNCNQVDTLYIAPYINELKRSSLTALGPPPTIEKPKTKWKAVKI